MKNSGNFLIVLGALYAFHKLIGTEPNVNAWWIQVGLGVLLYWIGETTEHKAKQKRKAKIAQEMQDLHDRNEQWRKERGL